ncbi:MAG: hypothetical protein H6573_33415 [Lewinellaceae bacterium]|nr:hypothetical protein [Lewinellaceae bacterium]
MKTIIFSWYRAGLLAMILFLSGVGLAQQSNLQYFRPNNKDGLSVFETSKRDTVPYSGLKVRVGGDFAIQFQGLSQSNSLQGDTLVSLASNINLPSANLNLDVQLADGFRMHLRTYLSSRNHNEAWVKGGYIQLDKLDLIQEGFLEEFMNIATIRVGMDEINYGDTHFRRSDNAMAVYNPFVGNYIMDAFTTEPFIELTMQKSGFLGVVGVTNGRLNQSPLPGDDGIAFYAKLGYDKEVQDGLRLRLTGSVYSSSDKSTRDYLYNGDRAGARYYNVLEGLNDARVSNFLPRFNPEFGYQTAFQINPFVKFHGLEFFGVFEVASNGDGATGGSFTQLGAEVIYRFGKKEQLYLGGRYNTISGEFADAASTVDINRINLGGGWYLTKNVLAKLEYVTSKYDGQGFKGTKFEGAEWNGFVAEAAISF